MSWAEERFEAGRDPDIEDVSAHYAKCPECGEVKGDALACETCGNGDRELLNRAIAKSGLSATRFAETVMARESRTIRRWLKGESPIPGAAVMFLQRYVEKKR
jgi:hypothetical protein